MTVVWKFPLTASTTTHKMPQGCKVIDVATQDGMPTLWVLVPNTAAPLVHRTFVGFGTGHPIAESGLSYVGTAHDVEQQGLVFHIFERLPA